MILKKAEKADRKIYLELAQSFYNSPAVLHSVPTAYFEKTFENAIDNNPYIGLYIIVQNDVSAGYLLTAKTFSQEAGGEVVWIEEIFISYEYRGKGLGGTAISEIIDIAKTEKAARIRLEYEPDNTAAARLYKRLGFEVLGYNQMKIDF